jgi:hypothetical protein
VVAQLGLQVPEAGSGGGDLLAGGQVGEPGIELVEGVVESGEPVALAFGLSSEGGALGAGVTSDGGADGAGLLAFEILDPLHDRRPLLGRPPMFGVDEGLLLDGGRGEVAQGGSPGRGDLRDLGGDGLFDPTAAELACEIGTSSSWWTWWCSGSSWSVAGPW